jgi:hypothetical protein
VIIVDELKETSLDPILTAVLLIIVISFLMGIGREPNDTTIPDFLLLS